MPASSLRTTCRLLRAADIVCACRISPISNVRAATKASLQAGRRRFVPDALVHFTCATISRLSVA
jgi:hypothetical protein